MEKKINIAELLKDCPKDMELYSPIYGVGLLTKVTNRIHVKFPKEHNVKCFRLDGKVSEDGEIMLFPKGKTTWEGFHRPFVDGDVVVAENAETQQIFLLKYLIHSEDNQDHDGYCYFGWDFQYNELFRKGKWGFDRLATEEEKQKLFDAIKANGYKWNDKTKTLEKLIETRFKVGDIIQDKDKYKVRITEVSIEDECYGYESLTINGIGGISFNRQDEWELVPNKFDITTLKPFAEVLVRDSDNHKWVISFFGNCNGGRTYKYSCVNGAGYAQCIPYEGNEHLLDKTDDCDDFYKTWEK